jgi:hypothetical protein
MPASKTYDAETQARAVRMYGLCGAYCHRAVGWCPCVA